jgi:hypothetical protein
MPDPGIYKKLYQFLKWSSLAALVLALILVLRKSPAPNIPFDANAAARAEQKFQAADQAKAAGQPSQVQLDRSELNSYLTQNLQLEGQPGTKPASPLAASGNSVQPASSTGAPDPNPNPNPDPAAALSGGDQVTLEQVQSTVKDVKVDMDGDLVKAYVIFDYHGKDLSLELDGHLTSDNGYIKFEPVAGKLGSMPLPQSTLQAAVDKMMSSPENREKLKLPADISDIQIQDGQAVVKYK